MRIRTSVAIIATALGISAASGAGALEMANGLTINGLSANGLTINGLTMNGLSANGLTINGVVSDVAQVKSVVLQDGSVVTLK